MIKVAIDDPGSTASRPTSQVGGPGGGHARLVDDRPIADDLLLTTVEGAEDFLVGALQTMASTTVTTVGQGEVRCRIDGTVDVVTRCRLFHDAGVHLTGPTSDPGFLLPLVDSARSGLLSALTAEEAAPTADRALRFRVGTGSVEVRQDLVNRVERDLGWVNDPADYDVNLTDEGGTWTAQVGALHWTRRFGALERQPWSTTPIVAEVLVRLLKPTPGSTVLDPTCGTATLLIAVARAVGGCRLLGTDHDGATVILAHRNLVAQQVSAEVEHREATPFAAERQSVDRVVANLPFGKQVGSHDANRRLYPAVLHEISRTLTGKGRAVLLTEDKQLLVETVARTKGIKIIRDRLLRYRGATPTAYVLSRTRH